MIEKKLKAYDQWETVSTTRKQNIWQQGQKKRFSLKVVNLRMRRPSNIWDQNFKKIGSSRKEIEKRISDSRKIIGMLNSVLWSRNIIQKTKRTIFNTLNQNALVIGTENLTIKSANEKKEKLSIEMAIKKNNSTRQKK